MSAPAMNLMRVYQQSFDHRPYATLSVTNGILNSVGDAVAQLATQVVTGRRSEESMRYDFARTARFFVFGFAMGPLIGKWNTILERRFPLRAIMPNDSGGKAGAVSIKALGKRVAADQIIMAPIGLTAFIGSMGIMEGRNFAQIKDKYKDMFGPAVIANWQVWPLAQLVNFRFMPLPYRVPFQSTCGIFWTLYLSILNAK
ncbi:hypothetical protein PUNSTDRAFT_57419 [Punctularia strigosozonata HHB-11173 SS5]|uniref:uncharacterized protein n=1 Tax=Punctularia strigosozonata (strain HHB-11173) TaxID=741275 RepID=UPI0004418244|nr:uncharacterized protein PUNSTDRAFT_57419 [Punctularia strigosozonata HHB-11173 SS5]EIN13589.1 hypothetical protein PUNSTDRAFT_57419 [Punctularia strigosozonata HHB-11173 SS5]